MEDIILFGMGKYFCKKKDILKRYNVKFIVDNKVDVDRSDTYENTLVINPDNIDHESNEKIFLMAMNFIPMWRQLVGNDIAPSRIVYPYFEKPYFQSDSVVDEYVESITFDKEFINIKEKTCEELITISSEDEWFRYIRKLYKKKYGLINAISQMNCEPISRQFASERGTPVDRIYINKFLEKYSMYIKGDVLEVEDSHYTRKYGGNNVKKSYIMDVSSREPYIDFNANLETGDGIKDNIADCFILTQTLMYIFDLKRAAHNICRLLKHNGVALITCSGISQNSQRCMDSYGSYFNFNSAVFEKMFAEEDVTIISSGSYGNIKTVLSHIAGLCYEDIDDTDFDINDIYYPLIVYAVVKKNE